MSHTADVGHPAADYVESVGSDAPVPGGGSVAATVGALAAALGEMVGRFSAGHGDDEGVNARIETVRAQMATARTILLKLSLQDEAAFGAYGSAAALPRSTPDERANRKTALQEALVGAASVPLRTAEACHALKDAVGFLVDHGKPHLQSDAEIARILIDAAIRASAVNVRVNTAMIKDRAIAEELDRRIDQLVG